jgi:hypothetical protein
MAHGVSKRATVVAVKGVVVLGAFLPALTDGAAHAIELEPAMPRIARTTATARRLMKALQ